MDNSVENCRVFHSMSKKTSRYSVGNVEKSVDIVDNKRGKFAVIKNNATLCQLNYRNRKRIGEKK